MHKNVILFRQGREVDSLRLRSLQSEEISIVTSASSTPLVFTPSADVAGTMIAEQAVRENAAAILETVRSQGAILLRDFSVGGADGFERCLRAMRLELDQYIGGVGPRTAVTSAVYTSTDAPDPFVINYHTEMAYQAKKPAIVAFYCDTAPRQYGETPIFDCARVFDSLPVSLQRKLEEKKLCYRRCFTGEESELATRKTWQAAFGTRQRAVVEEMLRKEGLAYSWTEDGNLVTENILPAVVVDPATGRKCLNLALIDEHSVRYNVRHFASRYGSMAERFEKLFGDEASRPTSTLKTFFGDKTPLSREESEAIQHAAWGSAVIFHWRREDIVILNNIRFAHSRLNVVQPRKILVALAEPFDLHELELQ